MTGRDADRDGVALIPCQVDVPGVGGVKLFKPPRRVLSTDRVRYVGEPVIAIVADSYNQARDASELVEIEHGALPSVVDTAATADANTAVVWPKLGHNVSVHWLSHDCEAVDSAVAKAAKLVLVDVVNNRVVGAPMEPRCGLADHDAATGVTTFYTPSQGALRVHRGLGNLIFKQPLDKLQVVSYDVGGGFGLRGKLYPESIALVWLARRLKCPVKWRGDRSETFVSDTHGRDHVTSARMAFDDNGKILAVQAETIANAGAEALGLDPAELCRRNFIKPMAPPYTNRVGMIIDSGEFENTQDMALGRADWAGFAKRWTESGAQGKLIAGNMLEAATADIEFRAGRFAVGGTDRSVSLAQVADAARDPAQRLPGTEPGLDESTVYKRATECNFPNGGHLFECGACGAPPAIVGAVSNALRHLGIRHVDMPLTPERVWRAIQAATGRA